MRLLGLVGQRFGLLTVVGLHAKSRGAQRALLSCKCDCGQVTPVSKAVLEYGCVKSCGCAPSPGQWVTLTGRRFGRLLVLRQEKATGRTRSNGDRLWVCKCDCGAEVNAFSNPLRTGRVKSCGCLRKEKASLGGIARRDRLQQPFDKQQRLRLFRKYKLGAEQRDLAWKLSKKQFNAIICQDCCYCGSAPRVIRSKYGKHSMTATGVDRLDNTVGYLPKNCVPCCKTCNFAKNNTPFSEFKTWVLKVCTHLKLSNMGKV